MQRRKLGKTGLDVSPLGFGCAPAAFLKTDRDAAGAMIGRLLDAGMNLIDTATMYPGSETFIGEQLSGRRDDYVLVSKVGATKAEGTSGEPWSPELIRSSIDRGLQLMKTDVIDVMLLHTCELSVLEAGEAIGALVEARDAGKIRFCGYSGDNQAVTYAANLPDVAVVETSINITDQANIDALLPVAKKNNVGVIAKRPVANGAWKKLDQQQGMYRNYAKDYTERLAAMELTPKALGMTADDWAELALRFTLSFPQVSTAIVGTTNEQNALANLEAANRGPLSEQQVKTVRDAFKNASGSDRWRGLT